LYRSSRSGSGSREHPLIMRDVQNAPVCPRFPENRAVHTYSRDNEIGITVWYESDRVLLLIWRFVVIELQDNRNICDSFFFRRDMWRLPKKANLIKKMRFLSINTTCGISQKWQFRPFKGIYRLLPGYFLHQDRSILPNFS